MRKPIPPHNAGHPELSLAELEKNIADAQEALKAAQQSTSIARNHETDCLNRLRDWQKQFDQRVDALRMADRNGVWHEGRRDKQRQFNEHHEGGR